MFLKSCPVFSSPGNRWMTEKHFLICVSINMSIYLPMCVIKTNLMLYLSSVYFVNQPLHVSDISVAHHQEVFCIYTAIGTCCAVQLTVCWPVYCIYTAIGTCCAVQLTVCWPGQKHVPIAVYTVYRPTGSKLNNKIRTNCWIYTCSIPRDDGLQICPKHVEFDGRNKLRINSASGWFLLHRCIEVHGQKNIKFIYLSPLALFDRSVKSLLREDTYSCD